MKKLDTTNTFGEGLIMDLNPLVTPNNIVTNCLNGTITTFSGNENVLLSDMGNGRVETAMLPEGYVPLGTTLLGGIIYIVAYNPETKKCQIGSFPSPERNISTDELSEKDGNMGFLDCSNFYENDLEITSNSIKIYLTKNELSPGDKFCVSSENINDFSSILSAYGSSKQDINDLPSQLKFRLASILDNGKINYLDDHLVWGENNYYIRLDKIKENGKVNIDEYRNNVFSNYSVLTGASSGKLALIAELEAIDTFTTTSKLTSDDGNIVISFGFNWTYENKNEDSRSKINPIGCRIEYDDENNDENNKVVKYISFRDFSDNERKNDGSDDEITKLLEVSFTKLSGIKTFTLTPIMKYGYLKYLHNEITIDFGKVGDGLTDLKEYRYFVNDNFITLSYGLDYYPEEGKKINEIKFDFYPFNLDVYDFLQNGSASTIRNFDTNYLIYKNEKLNWHEDNTSENVGLKLDYDKLKPVNFKISNTSDSLLGHIPNKIYYDESENVGLKLDYVYLTKITIKYGDEERIYFRLLYTFDIFNSAYYSENDFSLLELSKYLKINYDIKNFEVKTIPNEPPVEIPNYIEELEITTKTYLIVNTYSNTLNFDVIPNIKYGQFICSSSFTNLPENISSSLINDNNVIKNTALLQYITTNNPDLKVISTNTLVGSENPNILVDANLHCTLQINNKVEIPISVTYGKEDTISVQYQTQKLKGEIYYLNSAGRDYSLLLGFDSFRRHPDDGAIAKFGTADNEKKWFSNIDAMGSIGNAVQDALKNTDWIAVCCNVWYHLDGRCHLWYGDGINTYGYSTNRSLNDGSMKPCFVFFAFKSIDNGTETIIHENKFYGKLFKEDDMGYLSSHPYMSDLSDEYLDKFKEDINSEIGNLYKLVKYSGSGKKINLYNNVIYWNNFDMIADIETILKNVNNNIKFKILPNLDIRNLQLKNCNYSMIDNIKLEYSIVNRVNLSSIIQKILSTSTFENLVYHDGDFKSISVFDEKAIYNSELNIDTFNDSIVLTSEGDKVYLKSISYLKNGIIGWRLEGQEQAIKNIKLWT